MLRQLMGCFLRRKEKGFIRAAEDGRLDLVQKLLETGANPNARSDGDVTVLMWAAARGHKGVVKVLLESGADPNTRTRNGRTASEIAIQEGHDHVAALLRENSDAGIKHAEYQTETQERIHGKRSEHVSESSARDGEKAKS